MTGGKDRDAEAHKARANLNTAGALRSLEAWALAVAPAAAGESVLDLGCGRGKLLRPYAEQVLPGGSALGVDISEEAVAEVNAVAARDGADHVRARVGDLDTVAEDLAGQTFDLIVSSYASYYATDHVGLLTGLRGLLGARGRVFVCGSGEGTNEEMIAIGRSVAAGPDQAPAPVGDFLTPEEIARVGRAYADARPVRLPNQVRFADADALLRWWRNHNLFVPATASAVAERVREHFARHGEFTLTKNVLGVLLRA